MERIPSDAGVDLDSRTLQDLFILFCSAETSLHVSAPRYQRIRHNGQWYSEMQTPNQGSQAPARLSNDCATWKLVAEYIKAGSVSLGHEFDPLGLE